MSMENTSSSEQSLREEPGVTPHRSPVDVTNPSPNPGGPNPAPGGPNPLPEVPHLVTGDDPSPNPGGPDPAPGGPNPVE